MVKKIAIFCAICVATIVLVVSLFNLINRKATTFNEEITQEINTDTTEELIETTTEYIPEVKDASLSFVGDLMVHQWQMDDAYDKSTGTYNFDYTFEPVYKYLQSSDLTVGNLETVFAGKEIGYSDYPCFNTPDSFLTAIKKAGFDVLTTANNHSMDKGVNGALRTIELLDKEGIGHFGTYKSQEDSESVFIKEVNGIKLAFVSATYGINGNYIPEDKGYIVNILSEEKIVNNIKKAKQENPDMIIVMPHLGNEYESYPKDTFKNWIDIMIKAGADAVIASHPHVLQPMEIRSVKLEDGSEKSAFVAYSMANFISSQRTIPRDTGVILNLKINKEDNNKAVIEEASFIPTWVQWRDTSGGYNIRVLSIYDALSDFNNGNNSFLLRDKDINRIKEAQEEATYAITGEKISFDNIKDRYYIYKAE